MLLCNKYCASVVFETVMQMSSIHYEYNLFNIGEPIALFVFLLALYCTQMI